MFTSGQLAYLKALTRHSAGNAVITYNRHRLLVKTGPTDDDYAGGLIFLFFAGILLAIFLFIGYGLREWWLVAGAAAGLGALLWGARRALRSHAANQQRPPDFVFDIALRSFFVLPYPGAPQYQRYPSHLLTDARVIILSSSQYTDDTVLELCFGTTEWVRALRVTNTPVAHELKRAIWACQQFAAA